jgi:hypothetical protein
LCDFQVPRCKSRLGFVRRKPCLDFALSFFFNSFATSAK